MRVPRPTMLLSGLLVSLCLLFAALWLLDRTTAEAALPSSHSGYYKISGQGVLSSAPAIPSPSETIEPLPPGVSVQPVITDLVNYGAPRPMYMQFDPAGRIFFTNQPGEVRLIANGVVQPSPVITFDVAFNPFCEIGLFGLALDPNFGSNHYVYVAYTAGTWPNPIENRVVRFTESNGHGSNPVTIFTSPQASNDWSMGAIHFGPDGKLYVAVGDDSNPANAQDVTVKQGKMHRINPDGSIPPDNPVFTQTGALPSLYAIGLRSGRDFTFDSISNNLFANDSGTAWDAIQGCDDEVNRIVGGYDYGWRSVYPCDDTNQGGPDPHYNTIPPMWSAGNPSTVNPMGIDVYRGTSIPEWTNDLFQCSMSDSYLRHFHLSPDRAHVLSVTRLMIPCGTDITTGPDGALYFFGLQLPDSNIGLFRIVGSGGLQTPTPTATPSCVPGFSLQALQYTQGGQTALLDAVPLASNNVWVAGWSAGTFVERWDGSQWNTVQSPSPGQTLSELIGLAAVSANDIWGVGDYNDQSGTRLPLIEHWDGSTWSVVPAPAPNPGDENRLMSVSAHSASDVWAVGSYRIPSNSTYSALIEHWDGTQWSLVPGALVGPSSGLLGVQAFAGNDVWASGSVSQASVSYTLVEHWDGTQWSVVPSPNVQNANNSLSRMAGTSPSDIWAVGYAIGSGITQTLAVHWDGAQWSIVPSPNPSSSATLFDVAVTGGPGSSEAWAAGYYETQSNPRAPLVEHWNGTQWNMVPVSSGPTNYNTLWGVGALSQNDVWAVGTGGQFNSYRLIEHYDGSCPTATATITPTSPPATATATRTPTSIASSTPTRPASATPTAACVPGFNVEYIRDAGTQLLGMSASSANDAWAVGFGPGNGSGDALIEHWDGTQWSTVNSPVPPNGSELFSVSALAPDDVWAAGEDGQPLIEHWDGTQWSVIDCPNPSTGVNILYGISARAPNDVWAVGRYRDDSNYTGRVLIEHWNGSAWSVVPGANPGSTENRLQSVAAFAPDNVWAVGYYGSPGEGGPLIEHWDGTQWSVVQGASTNPPPDLFGISGTGPNDIWAVGTIEPNGQGSQQTITEHWDGTQWSLVPSPNPGSNDLLYTVKAVAANDAWAVGYYHTDIQRNLVLHWDGTHWNVVPTVDPATQMNFLLGVAASPPGPGQRVWAAGYGSNGSGSFTLVEKYVASCTTATPTTTPTSALPTGTPTLAPSGTPTSVQASATPGSATGTSTAAPTGTNTPATGATATGTSVLIASPSPTTCSVQFPDVPPGSTFYQYVHCLACRGIITGYPDGTFGPNNPVTRGQLSKIVSNSAGYNEHYTTATFADVAVGSTFFPYIERLVSRGIISGYPCGGPGEPCPGTYFRPNANVTRGQTAKIVAIARNLPAPLPGQQTFEDVALGSNFWQWIEALASNGAIGGYPCGGQGEPCVPPGNRPYFRPNANVTRGQSAKIVSTAFFPNCGGQ